MPPLRLMNWTLNPLAETLLTEGYCIYDWPNGVPRTDETREGRFKKPAQDKLIPVGFQWMRERDTSADHLGMRIEPIPDGARNSTGRRAPR